MTPVSMAFAFFVSSNLTLLFSDGINVVTVVDAYESTTMPDAFVSFTSLIFTLLFSDGINVVT